MGESSKEIWCLRRSTKMADQATEGGRKCSGRIGKDVASFGGELTISHCDINLIQIERHVGCMC